MDAYLSRRTVDLTESICRNYTPLLLESKDEVT
jgi:hypothetical protein